MASADVELLEGAFEKLATEGFESMIPLIHPDFVMETPPGQAAEPQRYDGPDGFRRWWTSFYEVMDEVGIRPLDFTDLGHGRVAMNGTLFARGHASGIETEQPVAFVVSVADEQMIRIDFFESYEEAVASGLA